MRARGKALLPVFPLDPDSKHRAPVHSGRLQRLADVTGGAGMRRDNQQDHLGSPNRLTMHLARVFYAWPPDLTTAMERQPLLLQDSLELGNDSFLSINMGASKKHEGDKQFLGTLNQSQFLSRRPQGHT